MDVDFAGQLSEREASPLDKAKKSDSKGQTETARFDLSQLPTSVKDSVRSFQQLKCSDNQNLSTSGEDLDIAIVMHYFQTIKSQQCGPSAWFDRSFGGCSSEDVLTGGTHICEDQIKLHAVLANSDDEYQREFTLDASTLPSACVWGQPVSAGGRIFIHVCVC